MNIFKPPYIGAAFYPEVWDKSETEKDIKRMKDIGINMVRIAEFAWAYMEPEEGKYKLAWLHEVIKALEKNEIAVTMCTPTATPPEWLTTKYPEILAVREDGEKYQHDTRRHYCPTSPLYRNFSRKITEILVKEFSGYEAIIAWQLDNEFGCEFNTCWCDNCLLAFQKYLQEKYKTIEDLNELWGTGIWSQKYSSFDRIHLPTKGAAIHHPSLYYNYKEFMSNSFAGFAREQEKIIHRGSKAPVTTNGMPAFHRLDYQELFRTLDFVSSDLYMPTKELWKYIYEFDWMRPFKNKPYWIMETAATWAGQLIPGASFINRNSLRTKMWLTYALGGETVSFWHWRAHWSGQEIEWGSVTYSWGEPTLAEKSVRQVKEELKKVEKIITGTTVRKPENALHISYQSMWVFDFGGRSTLKYDSEIGKFYKVFLDQNIPRDIIYTEGVTEGYKTVFSPFLPIINAELLKKMKDFVLTGGTWVVGPLSGFRTIDNTAHKESDMGPIEDLLKIHVRHRFPLDGEGSEPVHIEWDGIGKTRCENFAVSIELKGHGKVLAKYSDGPVAGMNAVVEVPFGKGKVIFLGTLPENKKLKKWINELSGAGKCRFAKTRDEGVVITERVDKEGKTVALIIVEHAGKSGTIILTKAMKNSFTGKKVQKKLKIAPFDVIVLA